VTAVVVEYSRDRIDSLSSRHSSEISERIQQIYQYE
jgi:hypothetical protein